MNEHVAKLRESLAATPAPPEAMAAYLEKVHHRAHTVVDNDVAELKGAGVDEDTIFEQTIAAAISEGLRRLDAAERALT